MKKDNKAQGKKPFFARLLENQELETVTGGATSKLADQDVTLKYPSDNDEDVTLKYPSDGDESDI